MSLFKGWVNTWSDDLKSYLLLRLKVDCWFIYFAYTLKDPPLFRILIKPSLANTSTFLSLAKTVQNGWVWRLRVMLSLIKSSIRISSSPACPQSWTCPWTGVAPAVWTGWRSASLQMTGISTERWENNQIFWQQFQFRGRGGELKGLPHWRRSLQVTSP